jgi:hypothetical protein
MPNILKEDEKNQDAVIPVIPKVIAKKTEDARNRANLVAEQETNALMIDMKETRVMPDTLRAADTEPPTVTAIATASR